MWPDLSELYPKCLQGCDCSAVTDNHVKAFFYYLLNSFYSRFCVMLAYVHVHTIKNRKFSKAKANDFHACKNKKINLNASFVSVN